MRLATFLGLCLVSQAAVADGDGIAIGLAGNVTSVDPMFHFILPNDNLARHLFDRLVKTGEDQMLRPSLALSWRSITPTVWEFELRSGVKFHDGSPLRPEDIEFSIARAENVPSSPGGYGQYARSVTKVTEVAPDVIHIETAVPNPLLPMDLSVIHIVSKAAVHGRDSSDFNSGVAAVGTGPYKLVKFVPGDYVELVRNEYYWAQRPEWRTVTLLSKTNSTARTAALLAGDVDLIELVTPADANLLQRMPGFSVISVVSNRLIFLQVDHRASTPQLFDHDGNPFANANPLADRRVRLALSKAIDRKLLIEKIMEGKAVPTGQILDESRPGASSGLKVEEYDPDRARELLAEAGYAEGFRFVLHVSGNRYVNGVKIVQAIAQMLARINVTVDVQVLPHSVLRSKGKNLELSVQFGSWQSEEMSSMLRGVLATYDRDQQLGPMNRGRYSSETFDRLLAQGLLTFDEDERRQLFVQATEVAIRDLAIIPLYLEMATWAMRDDLRYIANPNQETLAGYLQRKVPESACNGGSPYACIDLQMTEQLQ